MSFFGVLVRVFGSALGVGVVILAFIKGGDLLDKLAYMIEESFGERAKQAFIFFLVVLLATALLTPIVYGLVNGGFRR